jgi:hypothetical protein
VKGFFFALGKLLEVIGMLCMPLALYAGMTVEGSSGMALQMRYLVIGCMLFYLGRTFETGTGRSE